MLNTDSGMLLWNIEFTKHLGLGETVAQAAASARAEINDKHSEKMLAYWGLNEENCYIAGDANQVVKH